MSTEEQLKFLQQDFIAFLQATDAQKKPNFGSMNLHQMIEHMTYSFEVAYGKIPVPAITPEDKVASAQRWLMSDAMFKPNIKNILLPDEPQATHTNTVEDAIAELEKTINSFVEYYSSDKEKTVQNAFYGMLNFEQQTQLLFKHATHHKAQFS
jgi:hypothetical protein